MVDYMKLIVAFHNTYNNVMLGLVQKDMREVGRVLSENVNLTALSLQLQNFFVENDITCLGYDRAIVEISREEICNYALLRQGLIAVEEFYYGIALVGMMDELLLNQKRGRKTDKNWYSSVKISKKKK